MGVTRKAQTYTNGVIFVSMTTLPWRDCAKCQDEIIPCGHDQPKEGYRLNRWDQVLRRPRFADTPAAIAGVRSASGGAGNDMTLTNAGAPTIATPAAASPSPVTGTTTALSVLGADAAGESHITYT